MKRTLVGVALLLLLAAAANPIHADSLSSTTTTTSTTCPPPSPTPPPLHVNPPAAPGCSSANVRFALLPGPRTCGTPFLALLSTIAPSAGCPLSSGGLNICNAVGGGCTTCTTRTTTPEGVLFTCLPRPSTGVQIITSTYALGPLIGTIASSGEFTCTNPAPPATPTNPPTVTPPTSAPTCSSGTIALDVIPGARVCGSSFQVLLRTTAPSAACPLSSGGLTICAPGLSCSSCNSQTSNSAGITFTCQPLAFSGVQTFTATYSFGPLLGTIANSAAFTCNTPGAPIPPPHVNPPVNPPHVNPPVNPPHVNPPVNPPHVNPPVNPPHVNPPVNPPHVNPPVNPPHVNPPVNPPHVNPPVNPPHVNPPVNPPHVNPPVNPPHVNSPVNPPHVNPPVNPPHVNPPVNPPHVNSPVNPPHVNPPVRIPTPPPHVNPPVTIPTTIAGAPKLNMATSSAASTQFSLLLVLLAVFSLVGVM